MGTSVGVDQDWTAEIEAPLYRAPMGERNKKIDKADEVVFKNRGNLGEQWANQQVSEYQRYIQKRTSDPGLESEATSLSTPVHPPGLS